MKKYFLSIKLLPILLVILGLVSCSSDNEDIVIQDIQIDSEIVVKQGKSKNITLKVLPENAQATVSYTWESSDTNIFTITDGVIIGVKEGKATLTVVVNEKPSIKKTAEVSVVTIVENPEDDFIVEFEDVNLRALMLNYDNNQDGKLQYSEALLIKELVISANEIESISGIEYLRALEVFDCAYNRISEVDLSYNTQLKELYANNNNIQEIKVSALNKLEVLRMNANRLSAIDVTNNPNLKELYIGLNYEGRGDKGSGITELDVTQNTKLEKLDLNYTNVSRLDLSQNKELKWLDFGLTSYTNPETQSITEIDFSNNLKLEHISCGAMVRTYNVEGELVEDKKGLTTIDVSMLPELKWLDCSGNSLKTIDTSNNNKLVYLNVARNYVEELDVSHNNKLDVLVCDYNNMTKLNIKNTALTELNCANNKLEVLDISDTKMSYLEAQDNVITNLVIGDKTFDTLKDGAPYLYMKLNNNILTNIDLSKQKNLAWLEVNNNKLTKLNLAICENLGGLLASNNQIEEIDLSGISRIWELQLKNNKLTDIIDLSHLNLSRLYIENNKNLTGIKVWKGFNETCTNLTVDHTTGKKESKLCYIKDDTAVWIK